MKSIKIRKKSDTIVEKEASVKVTPPSIDTHISATTLKNQLVLFLKQNIPTGKPLDKK